MGAKSKNKEKRGSLDRILTLVLLAVLAAGVIIMLYPTVSGWWNKKAQTKTVLAYDEAVSSLTDLDYTEMFGAAEAYNRALYELGTIRALSDPEAVPDYTEILDINGTGIMGYVAIDKINVLLPIYHGTSDSVLQSGAGHLEGSSLPVGGENTHCVLSSHRGLPGAMLFTDLDKMEIGDTFTVTVLDRTLTYEVDKISTVLPEEYENLYIEDGGDYLTLMTCTPYGINTHRLLVRGKRTEGIGSDNAGRITSQANRIDTVIAASAAAVLVLALLIIWLIISSGKRKNKT